MQFAVAAAELLRGRAGVEALKGFFATNIALPRRDLLRQLLNKQRGRELGGREGAFCAGDRDFKLLFELSSSSSKLLHSTPHNSLHVDPFFYEFMTL